MRTRRARIAARRSKRRRRISRVILSTRGTGTTKLIMRAMGPEHFRRIVHDKKRLLGTRNRRAAIITTASKIIQFAQDVISNVSIDRKSLLFALSSSHVRSNSPIRHTHVICRETGTRCSHTIPLTTGRVIARERLRGLGTSCRRTHLSCRTLTSNRARGKATIETSVGNFVGGIRMKRKSCIATKRPLLAVARGHHLRLHTSISRHCCETLGRVHSTHFGAPCSSELRSVRSVGNHLLSCNQTSRASACCVPIAFRFSGINSLVPNTFMRACLLKRRQASMLALPLSTLARRRNICFICLRVSRAYCIGQRIGANTSSNLHVRVFSNIGSKSHIIIRNTCRIHLTSATGAVPTRSRSRW